VKPSYLLREAAPLLVAPGIPDHRSVRIWVRTDRPGRHRIAMHGPGGPMQGTFEIAADDGDGTGVVRWPDDVGGAALEPHTTYTFEVFSAGDALVGEGRFTTAPASAAQTPDRFSFAFGSCHQPFADDGTVRPEALALLSGLEEAFDAFGVEALLLLGDQMYTDLPARDDLYTKRGFRRVAPEGRRSILECTAEEVRAILHGRYRAFFRVEPFRRLQARFANAMILDDHEIADNFGTDPAHGDEAWRAVREGALEAFHDYQGLRNVDRPRPASFDVRFGWGPVATLMLDLRSQRRASEEAIRILSDEQWARLERFLSEESARPVLVLGLPVPLLHVPEWLVDLGRPLASWGSGVHDRWSHPLARGDRDRLVRMLRQQRQRAPDQKVVLLSGDVHVGVVSQLFFGDGSPPIVQAVSSALSNLESLAIRIGSGAMADLGPSFRTADGVACRAALLVGCDGATENPTLDLNAGLLTFRRTDDPDRWTVRVRLLGPPEAPEGRVRVVYDSGEIT